MNKTLDGISGCAELTTDEMQNIEGGMPIVWIAVGIFIGYEIFVPRSMR